MNHGAFYRSDYLLKNTESEKKYIGNYTEGVIKLKLTCEFLKDKAGEDFIIITYLLNGLKKCEELVVTLFGKDAINEFVSTLDDPVITYEQFGYWNEMDDKFEIFEYLDKL